MGAAPNSAYYYPAPTGGRLVSPLQGLSKTRAAGRGGEKLQDVDHCDGDGENFRELQDAVHGAALFPIESNDEAGDQVEPVGVDSRQGILQRVAQILLLAGGA
jgi:hypothetical protein